MRNIWVIASREFKNYFSSPLAYAVMLILLLTVSIIFALTILQFNSNSMFGFGGGAPDSDLVAGPMAFLLIFTAPALTMRLIADEQRMGTLELLLTAPVRDVELVIGKWFGALLFMLSVFGISLVFPVLLNFVFVDPGIDLVTMLTRYLGLILVTMAFLSMGIAFSALFTNQFAAYFASMALIVLLWWLIGSFSGLLPSGGEFFSYIDMSSRFYNSFMAGVINLSDLVYYISLTALGLFIATAAVEMRRWR